MICPKILCLICLLTSIAALAQVTLPIPRNIQKTFDKNTRSTTGEPGKAYWQNRAEYDINAEFNPATLFLKGNEKISYTNNSPDTLREIVFKLYPNLFKKGAMAMVKIVPEDLNDGMVIEKIVSGTKELGNYRIDGTNMIVPIQPLAPKNTLDLSISFHYTLNKSPNLRTGQIDANSAFVSLMPM